MNIVMLWLALLRSGKDKLPQLIALYEAKPQTPQCPTVVLFGQQGSDRLYSDFKIRPALDAWDVGKVSSYDICRWARYVAGGETPQALYHPRSDARHVHRKMGGRAGDAYERDGSSPRRGPNSGSDGPES